MSQTEELTIDKGRIRFYNHFVPALDAGAYEIAVEQKVDLQDTGDAADPNFTAKQIFHVDARRFTLGPEDVHAVFPPANQEGVYELTLPHVVLRKRSLPWERNIGGGTSPRPWLALLLFHPGEAPEVEVRTFHEAGRQTANPDQQGIFHPDISVSDLDDPQGRAQCIDIPRATFEKIAPTLEDLPFLAHVRQVRTDDKELLGLDVDGWFSVILGNRLPKPGPNATGGLNTAHLVSLEGFVKSLPLSASAGPEIPLPAAATKVRMISLASWSFTVKGRPVNSPEPRSFNDIATELTVAPLRVPKRVPANGSDVEQARLRELVNGALERGYVPLAYDMRHGEKSVAWYRGPLLPVRVGVTSKDPFPSAEAALIYDDRTGMFDVSYAVAWQIGRLLALADAQFTANLSAWRQRGQHVVDLMLERDRFLRRFEESDLLTELDRIAAATGEEQRRLLVEFVGRLRDPQVFSRAIGHFVADPAASPLRNVKEAPNGKSRLARGLKALTPEQAREVGQLRPGIERARRIAELLQAP